MSSAPLWKLRRIAPRSVRVIERRAGEHGAIAAYAPSLVPKATVYMALYDELSRFQPSWKKEMAEGRSATAALLTQVRGWTPIAARDIPGFDAAVYGDRPEVHDDLIADGERLVDTFEALAEGGAEAPAYVPQAIESLSTALEAAIKESAEAEAADRAYQKLQTDSREAAEAFDQELQLFRRTLQALLGRSDKDFQKLRATRASRPDPDDDPNAPAPTVLDPAPDDAPAPTP